MGNCYISRRVGDGSSGESYTLPSGYTAIDYVICGDGTKEQSGFTLYNVDVSNQNYIDIITTTPTTNLESAFIGDGSTWEGYYKDYYQDYELRVYSGLRYVSNSWTTVDNGVIKNNTRFQFKDTVSSFYPFHIGYYSKGNYKYKGRIYSVIISIPILDNDKTVTNRERVLNHLVPCIRESDNCVGMFDLICQVFYFSDSDLDPFVAPT